VKHIGRGKFPCRLELMINRFVFPNALNRRLKRRQIRLHWNRRFCVWQVESRFKVHFSLRVYRVEANGDISDNGHTVNPVRSIDVARKAGVSRTTVSYVLNGRTDVSIPEETRARVLSAAEELGYRPNMAARALVMGRTGLISLWLIDTTTIRHQADVLQAVHKKITRDGSDLIINRMVSHHEHEEPPPTIADWQVDGILAYNIQPHFTLPKTTVPLVSFGCYYYAQGDYVGVDLKAGVTQAMHHLVSSGRRTIAFVVNQWGNRAGDDRRDAYAETMAHYGLEPKFIVGTGATSLSAKQAVADALKTGMKFDALMCFSDEMALGAYRAVLDSGLKVPEDCALVGVDGLDELAYLEVPITTIVQPTDSMCRMAWDFLKNRLADPKLPEQQLVLPATLVIRESSDLS
jgi:LacI family transcriptional regulator